MNKLTFKHGRIFEEKEESFFSFPEPDAIAKCSIKELMTLGFSRHKSEALLLIASITANKDKTLSTEFLQRLSNEEIVLLLFSLKGFGRWSAEYILLRGLGRIEVLPGDDVAVHKSIKSFFKLRKELDFERIKKNRKRVASIWWNDLLSSSFKEDFQAGNDVAFRLVS